MLVPVGRSGTITEAIAGQLIRLIMSGRFKPGDRLPSELELAKTFQAGRGTVREALKALSVIGLVQVIRGKGTFVSERESYLTRPLSLGVRADTELRRLIEARRFVEMELAGLAAERANAEQIQTLKACLDHMAASTEEERSEQFLEADLNFHFALAAAADNFIMAQFLTLIHNLMRQWISEALFLPGVAREALRQHRRVFAAVQDRKPSAARKAMDFHLTTMGERFLLAEDSKGTPKSEQETVQPVL